MNQETENQLARLCDRQRALISKLNWQIGVMNARAQVDAQSFQRDERLRADLVAALESIMSRIGAIDPLNPQHDPEFMACVNVISKVKRKA